MFTLNEKFCGSFVTAISALIISALLSFSAFAYDVESDSTGNVIYVLLDNQNAGAVYHSISISVSSAPAFINGVSASLIPETVPGQAMRLAAVDFNVNSNAVVGQSGDLVLQIGAVAAGNSVSTSMVVPLEVAASAQAAQGHVGTGIPYADPDGVDTDGDGANDSAEITFGSDLNDASSIPGDGSIISSVNVPLMLLPFYWLAGLGLTVVAMRSLRLSKLTDQSGSALPATLVFLSAIAALMISLYAHAGATTRIQLTASLPDLSSIETEITATQAVTATASSTGGAGGANLAVDGSMATRWESQHGIDPSWIVLDFGSQVDLTSISIFWEAANAANYQIQGSNNNASWTTLISETGGQFGDRTDTHALNGSYRYLRIYGTARSSGNMWGYSIWEIVVYGQAVLGTDTDNDGVADSQDACANTPQNTVVGANGCEPGVFGGYDAPTSYPGYTLAWSDEFNGNQLDANNWTHEIGTGCPNLCGWGNNELQYYRAENTSVANGLLTIEARDESYFGRDYTSSRIKSQGKQFFTYGRVDVRAILPEGTGLWPAIWMLGESISTVGWPRSGEIDIMEMRGNEPNKVLAAGHWLNASNNHQYYSSESIWNGSDVSPVLASGTFADEFHVFSIVWDANSISWYLDGATQPFHVLDTSPSSLSEFQENFFLLFNIAIGGNFLPNPNGTAQFPQKMIIDYVRVYQ